MQQEIKTLTLRINDEDARKKIDHLRQRLALARRHLDTLTQKSAQGEALTDKEQKRLIRLQKEVYNTEKALRKYHGTQKEVDRVLRDLSGASIKDLKGALRSLNKELESGNVKRGTEQWREYQAQIARTKDEIARIKTEQEALQKSTGSSSTFSSASLSWAGGMVLGKYATHALNSAMQTMGAYVEAHAHIKEAEAEVIKYTGMTAEEVAALNEDFKRLDTRTPRQQLNALAGDAGRLGIQGRKDVLAFVEAADQINVALGADLGEDAVKQIGKLAQLFGDDKEKGLKGAMLATGSVVNELAQTSSASESYIVDFTARLAGIGVQAGLTQAQIMAYGAVLDQAMVSQEKGATALQNIITALMRHPAQMARAAGLEVTGFTHLLRTDANAALLAFAQALQRAGRLDTLAPMLEQMRLSGAGVTQTLATLAGQVDHIKTTQAQATEAFAAGTSVQQEYTKANNTVQAALEKQAEKMQEVRRALGEQLAPLYDKGAALQLLLATSLLSGVQALRAAVSWTWEHRNALAALATGLAALWTLSQAYTAQTKVHLALSALRAAWDKREIALMAVKNFSLRALLLARLENIKATGVGLALTRAATAAQGLYRAALLLVRGAYLVLTGQQKAAVVWQNALNAAMAANPVGALVTLIVALGAALLTALGVYSLFADKAGEANEALSDQIDHLAALHRAQKDAAAETAKERTRIEVLTALVEDNTAALAERQKALETLKSTIPEYTGQLSAEGKLYHHNTAAISAYIARLEDLAMARAVLKEMEDLKAEELRLRLEKSRKENNRRRAEYWKRREEENRATKTGWAATFHDAPIRQQTAAIATHTAAIEGLNNALSKNTAQRQVLTDYLKSHENVSKAANQYLGEGDTTPSLALTTPQGQTAKGSQKKRAVSKQRAKEEGEKVKKQLALIAADLSATRAQLLTQFQAGEIDVRQYHTRTLEAEVTAAQKRVALYKEGTETRLRAEEEALRAAAELRRHHTVWSIKDATRARDEALALLEEQHARGLLSEQAYGQQRNALLLEHLDRSRTLYQEAGDTEGYTRAEEEYERESLRQREAARTAYLERIKQLRERYQSEEGEKILAQELDDLRTALEEQLLTREEYLRREAAARHRYTKEEQEKAAERRARDGWDEAKRAAFAAMPKSEFADQLRHLAETLTAKRRAFAEIARLEAEGVLTHQQAEERKAEISKDKAGEMVQVATAAFATINALVQGAAQYAAAEAEAESAAVAQRYDRQIAAAGRGTVAARNLEERKQKEIAAVKTRANQRAMTMQMAQALVQVPMMAMNAYNSAAQTPIVGPVLAPIAAAAAVAAGMLQVAAVKKQHAAQAKGYYRGGFTGGSSYRREAGVVHEGEFVANHHAVNNAQLLPVLRLIDHAQRHNTVASLTAADVSRALPLSTATAPTPAPVVVSTTDPRTTAAIERLNETLEAGITSTVALSGPDGFERQWKRYRSMTGQR